MRSMGIGASSRHTSHTAISLHWRKSVQQVGSVRMQEDVWRTGFFTRVKSSQLRQMSQRHSMCGGKFFRDCIVLWDIVLICGLTITSRATLVYGLDWVLV